MARSQTVVILELPGYLPSTRIEAVVALGTAVRHFLEVKFPTGQGYFTTTGTGRAPSSASTDNTMNQKAYVGTMQVYVQSGWFWGYKVTLTPFDVDYTFVVITMDRYSAWEALIYCCTAGLFVVLFWAIMSVVVNRAVNLPAHDPATGAIVAAVWFGGIALTYFVLPRVGKSKKATTNDLTTLVGELHSHLTFGRKTR